MAVSSKSFSTAWPEIDLPVTPPYAPMEAKRVTKIPAGDHWEFEPKWDGFRAIVFRHGSKFLRWRPDKAPEQ
jgi:ATP-dependent DNA ligase